jgi:hypothetical protein
MASVKSYTEDDVALLTSCILTALIHVERSLPCSELDMKLHSILHIPRRILDAGPLHNVSMWMPESLWKKLLGMRGNNAHPELTMMNMFAYLEVSAPNYTSDPSAYSSRLYTRIAPGNDPEQEDDRRDNEYHRHKMAVGEYEVVWEKVHNVKDTIRQLVPAVLKALHEAYMFFSQDYQLLWVDYMPYFYDTTWSVYTRMSIYQNI